MGHLYPENIARFFIRRIYAKGKVSIKECVDYFLTKLEDFDEKIERANDSGNQKRVFALEEKRNEYTVHTAEAYYDTKEAISQTFMTVAFLYYEGMETTEGHKGGGIVEPIIETDEQQELIDAVNNLKFDEQEQFDVFDEKILWRFAKGGRQKYLNNKIESITYVCS
jgi:hypothetical protein